LAIFVFSIQSIRKMGVIFLVSIFLGVFYFNKKMKLLFAASNAAIERSYSSYN